MRTENAQQAARSEWHTHLVGAKIVDDCLLVRRVGPVENSSTLIYPYRENCNQDSDIFFL